MCLTRRRTPGDNFRTVIIFAVLYCIISAKLFVTLRSKNVRHDTRLTYASDNAENIESYLNQDLENIYSGLRANRLTLNTTKTELVHIESRQRQSNLADSPTLAINGVKVKQVTNTKSLGVIIDDRLDWSSHIEKLIKKSCFWYMYWCRKKSWTSRSTDNIKINIPNINTTTF